MKTQFIAWIATAMAAAGGVGLFMKVYGRRIFKGIKVTRDVLDIVDGLMEAIKPEADGSVKITPEEVKLFEARIAKLKENLK